MPKGKQVAGPLSGLIVLDLTWVLAGPYASMILRDLGAEVVKVERPPFGDVASTTAPYIDSESGYFFSINRGKKSVCLDLKLAAGRDLFLRLAEKADVVMETSTPGTRDGLGLGYETLSARNPRLVYAATSGFGQTGPDRPGPALALARQGEGEGRRPADHGGAGRAAGAPWRLSGRHRGRPLHSDRPAGGAART